MNVPAFILGLIWGFLRKIPLSRIFRKDFDRSVLIRTWKRRFDSIFKKRFRWLALLAISVLFGILRTLPVLGEKFGEADWYGAMFTILAVFQYGLMLAFMIRNYRKPGMLILALGTLLNGLVIVANGGMMPVRNLEWLFNAESIEKLNRAPHYFLAKGGEPLFFLADIVPVWIFGWTMISIGDIPILAGIFRLAAYLPRRIVRPRPKTVEQTSSIEYTEER